MADSPNEGHRALIEEARETSNWCANAAEHGWSFTPDEFRDLSSAFARLATALESRLSGEQDGRDRERIDFIEDEARACESVTIVAGSHGGGWADVSFARRKPYRAPSLRDAIDAAMSLSTSPSGETSE